MCVLREQESTWKGGLHQPLLQMEETAREAARQLNVPLHVVDFTRDISIWWIIRRMVLVLRSIRASIAVRMIQRAGEMMAQGASISWRRARWASGRCREPALSGDHGRDAALGGRLLRPLSADVEPTVPEQEGIVTVAGCLGLSGRSRKPQRELAQCYGLTRYPAPAGGCLLTEKGFCRKLSDLHTNEGLGDERLVWLLLRGRHFRLPGGAKCVVGRDAADNAALKSLRVVSDVLLHAVDVPGPTVLLPGGADDGDVSLAARICAAYADHGTRESVTIRIVRSDAAEERRVAPLAREQAQAWML